MGKFVWPVSRSGTSDAVESFRNAKSSKAINRELTNKTLQRIASVKSGWKQGVYGGTRRFAQQTALPEPARQFFEPKNKIYFLAGQTFTAHRRGTGDLRVMEHHSERKIDRFLQRLQSGQCGDY